MNLEKLQQNNSKINNFLNRLSVIKNNIDLINFNTNDPFEPVNGSLPTETINKILEKDQDIKSENIKSGVTVFGIEGSIKILEENPELEKQIIERTISNIELNIKSIGDYAFAYCSSLTSVNFPVCSSIGRWAFASCHSLTSVNFPVCNYIESYTFASCRSLTSVNFPLCSYIGGDAFSYCSSLTSVNFPVCSYIGGWAFAYCFSLTSVNFPKCATIGSYTFYICQRLTSITLGLSTVCSLANSNAFMGTSITSTAGSIFVPESLVNTYKSATNWAYFSNRIFAIA